MSFHSKHHWLLIYVYVYYQLLYMSKGTFIIPRIPSHEHFHNWAWSLSNICGTCSANWCFTMLYDHSSRYYPCLGYQPYLCPVCKSSYVQLQVTGETAALATQSKQSCNESVECRQASRMFWEMHSTLRRDYNLFKFLKLKFFQSCEVGKNYVKD